MASTVQEIMNRELLSVRAGASADDTIEMILEYGVTAVPVLDADGRPIGVTSLRDLVRLGPDKAPMTSPATTVAASASVASAAETMATTNRHHLVVVGSDGKAVGMVSTLDVVRALLGFPVKHPSAFPHHDAKLGASWSNDEVLASNVRVAVPEEPGVLVLVRGGAGRDEVAVWVEASDNLSLRVRHLANDRSAVMPELAEILGAGGVRFRYAVVPDSSARGLLLQRLKERIDHVPPPGSTSSD